MHVLITGASGMVGRAFTSALRDRGDTVTGVSRRPAAQADVMAWVDWDALGPAVEQADVVIHLTGADIGAKRWTAERRAELRSSRIDTGRRLAAAIRAGENKPRLLLSASAVGYYGDRGNQPLTEDTPPGDDFLAELCRDWEAAVDDTGVRTVVLRMGVILSPSGGALQRMLLPFRLGLGGPIGRGRQYFPWVHIDDVVGVALFAIDSGGDSEVLSGPVNVAAPEAVTNAAFSKALGRALHRPAILSIPPFVLRLHLGSGAAALTASQRQVPQRLQQAGYAFRHPTLEGALAGVLG